MSVTIRAVTLQDSERLADLLRGIGWFKAFEHETAAASKARVWRHLEWSLANSSHNLYAAEDDNGRLIGFVAVHWLPYLILAGLEGFISELFVAESARGRGVGKQLLQTVEEKARQLGCVRLSLLNGRHRESYVRQFYTKLGWEERTDMANLVRYL